MNPSLNPCMLKKCKSNHSNDMPMAKNAELMGMSYFGWIFLSLCDMGNSSLIESA